MLVQIDVDSTLYDANSLFCRIGKEHYNEDMVCDQNNWHVWTQDRDTLVKIFRKAHSAEYVQQQTPYPGAALVIGQIRDKGHKVAIVTDRHPQARGALVKWLESCDISYDELVAGKDKREWMRESKPAVVIDDRVRTMFLALTLGARVFSVEHPWNVNLKGEVEGIYIAKDWNEIGNELERII